jgi:hypothetical protein
VAAVQGGATGATTPLSPLQRIAKHGKAVVKASRGSLRRRLPSLSGASYDASSSASESGDDEDDDEEFVAAASRASGTVDSRKMVCHGNFGLLHFPV